MTPAMLGGVDFGLSPRVRSTKAGVMTPAMPCARCPAPGCRTALNEGRGDDPGDAWNVDLGPEVRCDRSTKAGVMTPAMLAGCHSPPSGSSTLNEGRGDDPGDA